mgnify:CR=1 FL=1
MSAGSIYKRILLKLSGESLAGDSALSIDTHVLDQMTSDLQAVVNLGVEVGIVIGGGNIFRGLSQKAKDMNRVAADHMGMLATVMNALAMRDALERSNITTRVMSAIPMSGVVDHYDRRNAMLYLSQGNVVIFSAGTGNPFFTTDSAAALRGIEVEADVVLKATKVDGVYDSDPVKNPSAVKYDYVTFNEAIEKQLGVMDLTAMCLCRDQQMPVRVFNMNNPGALVNLVVGGHEGTLVNVTLPKGGE